jgi:hypothetical protein
MAAGAARKLSWRIMIAQQMRAILFATATAASFRGFVSSSLRSHGSCSQRRTGRPPRLSIK